MASVRLVVQATQKKRRNHNHNKTKKKKTEKPQTNVNKPKYRVHICGRLWSDAVSVNEVFECKHLHTTCRIVVLLSALLRHHNRARRSCTVPHRPWSTCRVKFLAFVDVDEVMKLLFLLFVVLVPLWPLDSLFKPWPVVQRVY